MPAVISEQCQICHSEMTTSIGERVLGGELAWSTSSQCTRCGAAEEADGIGPLPDFLRECVLQQEGTWQLILESLGERVSRGLKALKDVFGLTYEELAEIRGNLPVVIHSGTKTEVIFYHNSLFNSYDEIVTRIEPHL